MAPAWSPAPDGLPFDLRATLVPDGQQHFIATFIRILSYIVKSNLENLCAFDAQAHANIFNRKGSTLVATMADFDGAARPEWMGLGVQRPAGKSLIYEFATHTFHKIVIDGEDGIAKKKPAPVGKLL